MIFVDIISRYDLQDIIHLPEVNNIKEALSNEIPTELKDKKLQKLWYKAQNSGFSGNLE